MLSGTAPDSKSKGQGFDPRQERREFFCFVFLSFLFFFFSLQSNFFSADLLRYPFHPRGTAVARKRSRSVCQKCRWQIAPKHPNSYSHILLNFRFAVLFIAYYGFNNT